MQGSEDQVTRFCGGQRQTDGFQIPHFTHQNDVRIFPQRGTQGVTEAEGVAVDFPLVDQAAFVLMDEFDWIFDRQYVVME